MAIVTQLGNYVKFLRGTPAAYAALTPKDDDTLYFVSERNADRGVLYLGEKLISGSLTGSTTLEDLTDTLISSGVSAGSLLYFNGTNWIDKPLSEIFEIIVGSMTGATATTNGAAGLVPVPMAGQQNLYLKGDGTWADPTAALSATVTTLVDQVGTLIGNDTGKSAREIASEEVAKVVNGAPAALDTLKEIADYISEHADVAEFEQRIEDLETAVNDPSTGLLHRTEVIEITINSMSSALQDLAATDASLAQDIAELQNQLEALRWKHFEIA